MNNLKGVGQIGIRKIYTYGWKGSVGKVVVGVLYKDGMIQNLDLIIANSMNNSSELIIETISSATRLIHDTSPDRS